MIDIVERLAENSKRAESPIDALAMDDAKAEITRLRAKVAKADALADALTQIANAPSEMTWGEEAEVNETMNKMEAIADAALDAYREADT